MSTFLMFFLAFLVVIGLTIPVYLIEIGVLSTIWYLSYAILIPLALSIGGIIND